MTTLASVNAMLALVSAGCFAAVKLGPARQELDWPAYLGTPRHDAAAGETLNPDPRLQWRVTVGRAVRGSPALGETVLAAGTTDRHVVLVDRATGETLWRERLDGSVRAGPLLDVDRLYVATETESDGYVYALRLRDGRRLWRRELGSVAAPLAFDGEAVYAGTEQGIVARLDTAGGRIAWQRTLYGAVRAAPVITDHGIAVATTGDSLYLLDRRSGEVLARRGTPGTVLGTPATDGARLFAGTVSGTVLAIGLPDLDVQWEHDAGGPVYGAPALSGDTLYVMARHGRLWVLPAGGPGGPAGEALSHTLGIVAVAGPTPLVTGVLLGSVAGEVLLVDRLTGQILWRAQVTAPIEEPPLVHDRQVVVTSGRGHIQTYR